MKVTVDALPLLGDAGITSYVGGLVRALLRCDLGTEYELLFRVPRRQARDAVRGLRDDPTLARATFRCVRQPARVVERGWRWGRWTTRIVSPGLRPDVFLATLQIAPWLEPGRIIAVVYDLVPLRFPHLYAADAVLLERRLGTLARRLPTWMVISEATRADLAAFLGIPASSIRVVYPGVDPSFAPPDAGVARRCARERYGIDGAYVLYVGGYGAHKNVMTLLEAFRRVRAARPASGLVLVGPTRWASSELRARLGHEPGVTVLGHVPREDLPLLYGAADVFVSVSLYEGFGLPALEALACGTPVVASHAGALPEAVGPAGRLVDPLDVAAITEAVLDVLEDPRTRLRPFEAGVRQAAGYSWERAAQESRALFAEAT